MSNPKTDHLVAMIEAINKIDPGDDITVTRVEFHTHDGEHVGFYWSDDDEGWRLWDFSAEGA